MHQGSRQTKLLIALLLLATIFPLIVARQVSSHLFLNDDLYITLTYAKNLVGGQGFVFNQPPPTFGTTTPLLVLVVAGFSAIFPYFEVATVAVFFTALCWIATAWSFFVFRRTWALQDWQAGLIGVVIIGSLGSWVGFLGMEAYPFAFLLVLSLSLFWSGRYLAAGFATGLLFLTRGEGVLILLLTLTILVVKSWHERKTLDDQLARNGLKLIAGFGLPVLVWTAYSLMAFGSFLPNTLAAKQAQAQNGLGRPFLGRMINEWLPSWEKQFEIGGVTYLNLWWLLVIVGVFTMAIQRRKWLVYIGWIGFYIIGYAALNVSAYWWYQLPIRFVLQLLFGLGLIACVEALVSRVKHRQISVGISIIFVISVTSILVRPSISAGLSYQGDPRGPSYTALAQWFRQHAESSESIAFIEIGYLGYYTDNRIIDLAGLILPEVVPHVAKADFAWGFWHYQPEYYVYLPDFDSPLGSIRTDSRFEQQYRPVTSLPGPRGTDFVVYKRLRQ